VADRRGCFLSLKQKLEQKSVTGIQIFAVY